MAIVRAGATLDPTAGVPLDPAAAADAAERRSTLPPFSGSTAQLGCEAARAAGEAVLAKPKVRSRMHYLLNQKKLVFLLLDLEGALWHRTAACRDRHRRDKEGSKGRREGHDRQHRAGRRDRRQGVQSEGYGLSVFVPLFRVIGGTNSCNSC